ncbi:MAG: nuclear transport factor 2 family protein [Chloroflexi bacterium]|nr:nuclear transport factor 2 family protein [Chloroflexota bacterium]
MDETRDDAMIRAWFGQMETCVQTRDFTAARALFAADVIGFGTRASLVRGLGRLTEEQWHGIWPNIEGFHFDMTALATGGTGSMRWAVCPWSSTGFDEIHAPFDRPGRATVIFRVDDDGALRAIHTHFSLAPGTPQRTFGRA